MPLKVGDAAPEFTLPASTGEDVSLAQLRGKTVVLYFYPKDNTPGCTAQACEYRDLKAEFDAQDAVIFGVSRDGLKAHGNFIGKYELNFPLLTDKDAEVHKAYGAWGIKKMYGRESEGVLRSTVVIDPEGKIKALEHKVKAKGNAQRTLELL